MVLAVQDYQNPASGIFRIKRERDSIIYQTRINLKLARVKNDAVTSNRSLTCDICLKVLKSRADKSRHKQQAHGNGERQKCAFCSVTFCRKDVQKRHERKCKSKLPISVHIVKELKHLNCFTL